MASLLETLQLLKQGSAAKPIIADDDEFDSYTPVGLDGVLAATEKLLAVNRGLEEPDERDSLVNDRTYTPDMLLAERIRMDRDQVRRKLMWHAARHRSLKGLNPFAFDDYAIGLLTKHQLSQPLEEINPLHIAEQARRMTKMGPGGIGDPQAVTDGMQAVNTSQFGFIDPVAGPESELAGLDTRLAHGVRIGSDRRLYQRFRNKRTGKLHWVSPEDLDGAVIKLPD